jgi:hypothetical protein
MQTITQKISMRQIPYYLGILLVILGILFAVSRLSGLFGGTKQSLNITDGMIVHQAKLGISGSGQRIQETLLNGVPVTTSPNGVWNTDVILANGINYITTENRTSFGKTYTTSYRVILNEPVTIPLAQNTNSPTN